MKQKDLAEEYALKEYARVNGESDPIFVDNKCFIFDDIKAAFGAGCESVLESLPELEWKNLSYEEEYYSSYSLGWSYRVMQRVNVFALFCNDCFLGRFLSIEQAKQAANEHYKKLIKQSLEL